MTIREKILERAQKGEVRMSDLLGQFSLSRQYLGRLIQELVAEGKLIKFGSTRSAFYVLPSHAKKYQEAFSTRYFKTLKNVGLEEHKILNEIEMTFLPVRKLPENIKSIFVYAFSEMLNNAIEHSQSERIELEISIENKTLSFTISDFGIGVFRNIQQKRKLKSELEAIQDLLKGKTTTMPKSHSGEGIFFTSKAGDTFLLHSFAYQLLISSRPSDVFVHKTKRQAKGTRVTFRIRTDSQLHLNDVFREYTNISNKGDYGFDKTEVRVKLYTISGIHVSRSQARRVLSGLEKFQVVLFDFDKVPTVGQAFADEIFRVFHNKYPKIKLEVENMEEGVEFMVRRVMN